MNAKQTEFPKGLVVEHLFDQYPSRYLLVKIQGRYERQELKLVQNWVENLTSMNNIYKVTYLEPQLYKIKMDIPEGAHMLEIKPFLKKHFIPLLQKILEVSWLVEFPWLKEFPIFLAKDTAAFRTKRWVWRKEGYRPNRFHVVTWNNAGEQELEVRLLVASNNFHFRQDGEDIISQMTFAVVGRRLDDLGKNQPWLTIEEKLKDFYILKSDGHPNVDTPVKVAGLQHFDNATVFHLETKGFALNMHDNLPRLANFIAESFHEQD